MPDPALSLGPAQPHAPEPPSRFPATPDLRPGHEPELRIEHRQALIYTLAKAAELEHLIICQYLFCGVLAEARRERGPAGGDGARWCAAGHGR